MTRDQRILADVLAGKAAITPNGDLVIDGRWCCDQTAGARFIGADWIQPLAIDCEIDPIPAVLTDTGRAKLAE